MATDTMIWSDIPVWSSSRKTISPHPLTGRVGRRRSMITEYPGHINPEILRDHGNRLCPGVRGLPPGPAQLRDHGNGRGGAGLARRPAWWRGLGRGGEGAGQAGQGAVAAEQLDRLIQWR